jgi:hypothetical protein
LLCPEVVHPWAAEAYKLELAMVVIVKTINIAKGIRSSLATSLKDLAGWKKALELFKHG